MAIHNTADYKAIPQTDKPGCDKGMLNTGDPLYLTPGKDKNAPGVNKAILNVDMSPWA